MTGINCKNISGNNIEVTFDDDNNTTCYTDEDIQTDIILKGMDRDLIYPGVGNSSSTVNIN